MPYLLPELPFPCDALEPYIDAKTVEIHHGKHHKTYVDKFNGLLAGRAAFENMTGEDILVQIDKVPEDIRLAVRNFGGGAVNHSLYWSVIAPQSGGDPKGVIGDAIKGAYGSFSAFKSKFTDAAMAQFGSGWAWLVVDQDKKLDIVRTPNQDTPLSSGKRPILLIDVWEHAYYLKYQNRRAEHIEAFYNIINWGRVDELYSAICNS